MGDILVKLQRCDRSRRLQLLNAYRGNLCRCDNEPSQQSAESNVCAAEPVIRSNRAKGLKENTLQEGLAIDNPHILYHHFSLKLLALAIDGLHVVLL